MKLLVFIAIGFLAYANCEEKGVLNVLDQRDSNGNENELVMIDLKKKDEYGNEIRNLLITVQFRIHLVNGTVNINGNPLSHGIVHHLHMRLTIIEVKHGVKAAPKLTPVHMRVLVVEKTNTNGNKVLVVEEEFLEVEQYEVIQVDVKQVVFESSVRKPVTIVTLKESEIHSHPCKKDHHMFIADKDFHPRLPKHGLRPHDWHYRHHHHHGHHGHHEGLKCWFRKLSWKSKLALFSLGFLFLIALTLCCSICVKKRRARRSLEVTPPMDNTIAVDMEDEKKTKVNDTHDFHFEMDNSVIVDDKKPLVG